MPAWWNMSTSAERLHVPVSSWGVWCTLWEWHDQWVPVFTLQEWRILSWQNRSVVVIGLKLFVVVNLYVWDSCLPVSFNLICLVLLKTCVTSWGSDLLCDLIAWWTGSVCRTILGIVGVWTHACIHISMHTHVHVRTHTLHRHTLTCTHTHTHTLLPPPPPHTHSTHTHTHTNNNTTECTHMYTWTPPKWSRYCPHLQVTTSVTALPSGVACTVRATTKISPAASAVQSPSLPPPTTAHATSVRKRPTMGSVMWVALCTSVWERKTLSFRVTLSLIFAVLAKLKWWWHCITDTAAQILSLMIQKI